MANLLVAQSGGPTAAINSTLVGILQGIQVSGKVNKVFGARNGIDGVIKGNFFDLSRLVGDTGAMRTLMHTPSSALGTSRYKLPKWDCGEEIYKEIVKNLLEYGIKYFIFIGGNDSMDTVDKLSEYCIQNNHEIYIMGAPKQ